jgi:hypothetical protein
MKQGLILCLALYAGLLTGILSRYLFPTAAFAWSGAPRDVTPPSFVLVDEQNDIVGVLQPSKLGSGETVVLLDRNGRELWRAVVSPRTRAQR